MLHWPLALVLLVQAAAPAARTTYLFSYFTGNGEGGLRLAESADGITWTALNSGQSFLTPAVGSKLMRDPSIARGPDGTFHMVWTTGWWDRGIGLAHSKDLRTWSDQQFVPVMEHEPDAQNCWAPEMPDRYVMIVKDETIRPKPKKHLRVAEAKRPEGPYGPASEPVSIDWVEGPSVLKLGDGWIVYYDEYTRKRYGAIRSRDLKSWETVGVTFPAGTRHGTAFAVPADIAARLR